MRAYTDLHSYKFYSKHGNIFRIFVIRLFIYYYYYIFFAWLLNKKDGCDDLPGSVTPQASMKLSPPHRSPTLPRRGAGAAGMVGIADSPAQGE